MLTPLSFHIVIEHHIYGVICECMNMKIWGNSKRNTCTRIELSAIQLEKTARDKKENNRIDNKLNKKKKMRVMWMWKAQETSASRNNFEKYAYQIYASFIPFSNLCRSTSQRHIHYYYDLTKSFWVRSTKQWYTTVIQIYSSYISDSLKRLDSAIRRLSDDWVSFNCILSEFKFSDNEIHNFQLHFYIRSMFNA